MTATTLIRARKPVLSVRRRVSTEPTAPDVERAALEIIARLVARVHLQNHLGGSASSACGAVDLAVVPAEDARG